MLRPPLLRRYRADPGTRCVVSCSSRPGGRAMVPCLCAASRFMLAWQGQAPTLSKRRITLHRRYTASKKNGTKSAKLFRDMKRVEHPINLNIGQIAGGDWPSSVPAWCNFDVRVAIYPGQDIAEAKREIEQRTCRRTTKQFSEELSSGSCVSRFRGRGMGYSAEESRQSRSCKVPTVLHSGATSKKLLAPQPRIPVLRARRRNTSPSLRTTFGSEPWLQRAR